MARALNNTDLMAQTFASDCHYENILTSLFASLPYMELVYEIFTNQIRNELEYP